MQLSTSDALFQCRPTMLLWFGLFLLQMISSKMNEYVGDNETMWESTSIFIPQSSTCYGSIKIGGSMKMEFDIIWNGRTDPNNNVQYEQFFRVGFPSMIESSSDYPSLWLQPNIDAFQLRVSCTNCNEEWNINEPILSIGKSYHFIISFNTTQLTVYLDGKLIINDMLVIQQQYIGDTAKIWFNSDRKMNENPYIVGNGIFSNITIISNIFIPDPTLFYPNNTVLDNESATKQDDLLWLIYIVIIVMVFALILFCCYKSKQIRKQMNKTSVIENQTNKSIINSMNISNISNISSPNMKEAEKLKSDSEQEKDLNNIDTPTSIPILININNSSLNEANIVTPREKKLVIASHSPSSHSPSSHSSHSHGIHGNGEIEVEMQINETNTNDTNNTNQRGETDVNEDDYKWIRQALIKIDDNKYEIYLNNFMNQMITDNRIKLLYEDDMKILIPEMGPRREFQALLKNKKDVVVVYRKQQFVD